MAVHKQGITNDQDNRHRPLETTRSAMASIRDVEPVLENKQKEKNNNEEDKKGRKSTEIEDDQSSRSKENSEPKDNGLIDQIFSVIFG